MLDGELVREICIYFKIEWSSHNFSRTSPMCWDEDREAGIEACSRTHAPWL